MHRKMAVIIIINLIILLTIAYGAFYFYKKNYLSYNLLRLDPLEESKFNKNLLTTDTNTNNIWLLGDSRIAQWDINFFSLVNTNTVNLGIDGQTSKQVLERLKNHLVYGIPDWVIIEVGINDLKVIGVDKRLYNNISESCYNNIVSITELCKANRIKIICLNIFPIGKIELMRSFIWNSSINLAIVEINSKLKRYCERNDIKYLDTWQFLADKNGLMKEEFRNGFLHVNSNAYIILTSHLLKEFGDIRKN